MPRFERAIASLVDQLWATIAMVKRVCLEAMFKSQKR